MTDNNQYNTNGNDEQINVKPENQETGGSAFRPDGGGAFIKPEADFTAENLRTDFTAENPKADFTMEKHEADFTAEIQETGARPAGPAAEGAENAAPPTPTAQTSSASAAQTSSASAAQTSPATPTRDEWERQQREIQDREWYNRQMMYNRQLAEQRMDPDFNQGYAQFNGPGYAYPDQNEVPENRGGYQDQYNNTASYNGDAPWQPYDAQYARPKRRQEPYYAYNRNGYGAPGPAPGPAQAQRQTGGAPHMPPGDAYFYGARQPQPHAQPQPPQAPQGYPQGGQPDKRAKKGKRVKIIAAALGGLLLMAALLGVGFLVGNSGFMSNAYDRLVAIQAQESNAGAQQDQPGAANSQAGQAGPGSFFGGIQGQLPILPPAFPPGQDEEDEVVIPDGDGAAGGRGDARQRQPQQQQARPQLPAGSEELSSLTLNPPTGVELSVPEIYEKVYPSIVGVRITFSSQAYRFGGILMPGQERSGEGSGIIIHEDGFIMTNHHVISEVIDQNTRSQLEGTKIEVIMPDDSTVTYPAEIVGYDVSTDLCVLKVDKKNLPAAELGDADKLVVGEFAVAIGNPGGMEYMSSVTFGIISGLNRSIQTEGYRDIKLIQTDAAINPGNSGGALINKYGQVVGVNSIKIADRAFEGLGFAIPINAAVRICDDLINYAYVTGRPYIGITAYSQYTEQMAAQYNMPKGVYVYEVDATGPSSSILQKNDIIVKLNGVDIDNFEMLEREKNQHKPGDQISIQVYRNWSTNDYTSGSYVDVEITLGEKKY